MSKNDILLSSINNFYNEEKNRTTLMTILDKTSGISLRNLGGLSQTTQRRIIHLIKLGMVSYLRYTVPINQVSMATVNNFLIHSVGHKSLVTQFRVHLMKFKRHWLN